MNCGHPFFGGEKYCPECGQKNKGRQITFKSFVKEVFNGFISWDAKFWRTIIPLLTKPGKVSDDFINGKRFRYANPFQFYLSISILFFLMLGLNLKYEEFRELSGQKKTQKANIISFDDDDFDENDLDSITQQSTKELDETLKSFGVDSIARSKVKKNIEESAKKQKGKNTININGKKGKLTRMYQFYESNKTVPIGDALDSLKLEKTFVNRFLYRKMSVAKDFSEDSDKANQEFSRELISYASISIFLFLPIFTLFLKLFYIRRKYTYVEHLIFIFHTQTVFFILLSIFFVLNLWWTNENIMIIFSILFLIYLFLAMKRFYKQGIFKTLIKLFILNQIYFFMATLGFILVAALAFALY